MLQACEITHARGTLNPSNLLRSTAATQLCIHAIKQSQRSCSLTHTNTRTYTPSSISSKHGHFLATPVTQGLGWHAALTYNDASTFLSAVRFSHVHASLSSGIACVFANMEMSSQCNAGLFTGCVSVVVILHLK